MPSINRFDSEEILGLFDNLAESYEFPMFDNLSHRFGEARLTSIRSNEEWLVIIEQVIFFLNAMEYQTDIYAFGNKLPQSGLQGFPSKPYPEHWQEYGRRFEEVLGQPFLKDEGGFGLNRFDFEISIRGEQHSFQPTASDYAEAGIDVNSDMPDEAQVLRYLVHRFGTSLFSTPEQLLQLCGREDSDLKLFLQLDEWRHPDLSNDELPSETETFQLLAEALATNDPSIYKPSESPNTHWSNWTSMEND